VKNVAATLEFEEAVAFKSENDLEDQFDEKKLHAGIIFSKTQNINKQLFVTLRFPAKFRSIDEDNVRSLNDLYWITRTNGIIEKDNIVGKSKSDLYLKEGFIQIQSAIMDEWFQIIGDTPDTFTNFLAYEIRSFELYPCNSFDEPLFYDWLYYSCFMPTFCFMVWVS